ncbi:MAG: fibronectin type III domain-containing protein [Candidatus Omnitrophica bacterium]|nr:fibronectin type III domain-containing protein [Candidatus Omnitrophota bacterium]
MTIFKKMGTFWNLTMAVLVLLSSLANAQEKKLTAHFKNNPDGSQTLLNYVPGEVSKGKAQRIAHANSNQTLDLRIILPVKDQAGLDQLIKNLYDPQSPIYHKFITPEQFAQQFGASALDFSIVQENLKSLGLTVKRQSKNGLILSVTGPLSKVEHAFKLNVNNYKRSDGTLFFAPDADPTIPTPMAGKIKAVIGLDNAVKFQAFNHKYTGPKQNKSLQKGIVTATGGVKAQPLAHHGPNGGLEPQDVAKAYNFTLNTTDGNNQTLALFELDGYLASDISTYAGYFGFHLPSLQNVLIDGYDGSAGPSTDEVTLDIEIALGIAQGLKQILVYEAQNTALNYIDEWERIASDNIAQVVSVSWGIAEQSIANIILFSGFSILDTEHTLFQQMATQGVTIMVASGDAGAYNTSGPTTNASSPASDPGVTAVGISALTTDPSGNWSSETGSSESGGGISGTWPVPLYQQGLAGITAGGRNVPDVALTADNSLSSCYDVLIGGSWGCYWGSSVATPIWAALVTRVNQVRQTPIGFLNPSLYTIAQGSHNALDYHDITSGNNGFSAGIGYDLVTGLGSLIGSVSGLGLYNDLFAATPSGLTATAGNAQVTLSWSLIPAAVSYKIYRSTTSNSYSTPTYTGITSLPYTDNTNVINGTTYYYVVTSVSILGEESTFSSQVSATPIAPPSAPTGQNGTPGNTQATINWNVTPTATSYHVKRSLTSGSGYSTIATVTGTSFTDSGLSNNTPYYYVISALNASGEGANSVEIPLTPLATLPLAPTGVNAASGNKQVTLTWNANGATSYNVKRSPTSGGSYSTVSTPGAVTTPSYTDTNLTNGTTYYYVVSAVNGTGEGANSFEVSAAPQGMPAPTNIKATLLAARVGGRIVYGGVVLYWAQSIAPGVVQNKIYRSVGAGAYSLLATVGASTSYTDKNTTKGTVYNYKVTAFNSSGVESLASNSVTVNY